jgi:hypothetical protein
MQLQQETARFRRFGRRQVDRLIDLPTLINARKILVCIEGKVSETIKECPLQFYL